ncbi:MAG: methyltransferase [Litorimonas sp.]
MMGFKSLLLAGFAAITLTACGGSEEVASAGVGAVEAAVETGQSVKSKAVATASLDEILAAQSDEMKARYTYRNPKETLEFFGIEPGMTVVEVLPGGGWYSKILLPHLGDDGHLIGMDYALQMWPEFGGFADEEFLEAKKTWPQTWTRDAQDWRGGSKAKISAYTFERIAVSVEGTADAVLFIRAMHNLSRFEEKSGYLSSALSDARALLKPGGLIGVVQHQAPESNSAEATIGGNGYLKKSALVEVMKANGFELIKSSDINANPKDQPNNDEIVWRLPPNLSTSQKDPELKAKYEAIGETNRMTLLFKKL